MTNSKGLSKTSSRMKTLIRTWGFSPVILGLRHRICLFTKLQRIICNFRFNHWTLILCRGIITYDSNLISNSSTITYGSTLVYYILRFYNYCLKWFQIILYDGYKVKIIPWSYINWVEWVIIQEVFLAFLPRQMRFLGTNISYVLWLLVVWDKKFL